MTVGYPSLERVDYYILDKKNLRWEMTSRITEKEVVYKLLHRDLKLEKMKVENGILRITHILMKNGYVRSTVSYTTGLRAVYITKEI